jgi:hypothetical protein
MGEPTTIEEGKALLRENFEEGIECPCCGQRVKRYARNLYSTQAYCLIRLYRITELEGEDFYHWRKLIENVGGSLGEDFPKLRFWGLIREADTRTLDRNASGYWKITQKGKDFVLGIISVPKKVYIFNNKFRGFSDDTITIQQALKDKFDYRELMGQEPL